MIETVDLAALPHPAKKNIAIHITPSAERSLRAEHPWLYENSIIKQSKEGQSGDIAVIFDRKNRFLAAGLYDPHSHIRVKVLQHLSSASINQVFYRDKLLKAIEARRTLEGQDTNGYRLIYGEGDGFPGLILDRYDDVLVLKLYTSAWIAHLRDILAIIQEVIQPRAVVLRLARSLSAMELFGLQDGQILAGSLPEPQITFSENGLRIVADVLHGHKTGFFFDQRENRARVRHLAKGQDVLDVFSYTGGFSLYAAAGGAKSVLSMDISQPALDQSKALFELNSSHLGVRACEYESLPSDAFEGLQQLIDEGRHFGLVIVDPPSFANKVEQIPDALRAYERLARLTLQLTQSGSTFVMASCSSRIENTEFFEVIHTAAQKQGYRIVEIERTGHASDHPVRASFPEGQYLKCMFATVS